MVRTVLSLQHTALLSTITIIIGIVGVLKMIKYIYHFNDLKGSILSILGIIVISAIISMNIWLGILGNNSLFTFINDIHPFIDVHCLSASRIITILYPIHTSGISIFLSLLIHYIAKPIHQQCRLNDVMYGVVIIVSIFTGLTLTLGISVGMENTFEVEMFHAANNNKYKQCSMSMDNPPKIWGMDLFLPFCLLQLIPSLFILIICTKKLSEFNKYSSDTCIRIKYMLYLPIISVFLALSCFLVDHFFEWQFYGLSYMNDIIIFVYGVNTYFDNKNKLNNNNTNKLSVAIFSSLLQENKNEMFQNQIINSLSYSDSSISYIVDMPYLDLDKAFISNAYVVLQTLEKNQKIFGTDLPFSILVLIAEYSSTAFLPCVECQILLGYIETRKDWAKCNSSLCNMDSENNIRYYVHIKTQSWSQMMGQRDYEYDQDFAILCVQCAKQYLKNLPIKCKNEIIMREFTALLYRWAK